MFNPNLSDPANFISFETMRYSIFAINLINSQEYKYAYDCLCLFLNKT